MKEGEGRKQENSGFSLRSIHKFEHSHLTESKEEEVMKKLSMLLFISVFSVIFVAGTVEALPFNYRPITTDPGQLDELQNVFDSLGSSINVYDDQHPAAIFMPTSGLASSTYIATMSWNTGGFPIEFGLYEYGNISNTLILFDTDNGSAAGSETVINFNFTAGIVTSGDPNTWTQIDSAPLFTNFGFFIASDYINPATGTNIYYSEDDQNPNGIPASLIFPGQGDPITLPGWGGTYMNDDAHWYVAMEGYGGITDFTDFVAQFESITPVPEPATMMLFGSGLICFAFIGRKKLFNRG